MTKKRSHAWRLLVLLGSVALANVALTPPAYSQPTADGLADIKITQVGAPRDGVYAVGDVMKFDITVTNKSGRARSFAPKETNLGGEVARCKWYWVAAGQTTTGCTGMATHTVSAADIAAGGFTPYISYEVKATGYAGAALNSPERVSGARSVISAGPQAEGKEPGGEAERPQAEAAGAPDADASRAAAMSSARQLVANTATDKYRIPAITTAPNGDLLVAYDERPTDNGNRGGDVPNPNHIVQRRSTDGGRTWSAPTYIRKGVETGRKVGYSDPSYVVDYRSGTIFNFHVKSYDQGWAGSRAGSDPQDRGVIHAEVSASTDNGHTWTHRTITADITPHSSWTARFAASGQGIQIQHGPYAGRLVQQFAVKTSGGAVQAVSVYSDDYGANWRAGKPVGNGMDENKVVELSGGTLMLNSRASDGSGYRKVATSTDGGQTWSEPRSDMNLPDSVNNAQIIRAFPSAGPDDPRAKVLLLSHSPNPRPWSRDRGTISLSCDDGATWVSSRVFNAGFIGYSTIAVQSDGTIGLLSEDRNYSGIWYRNFSLAWLGHPCG